MLRDGSECYASKHASYGFKHASSMKYMKAPFLAPSARKGAFMYLGHPATASVAKLQVLIQLLR
ncbi:hypothetical protein AMK34_02015 [Amycolatopsis sp. CB00013]|nr:hypothetical protein AMK34_02015 [Amycolatopsis sp. CB00013]